MTTKQKERLLKSFFKSKTKEYGLIDWQLFNVDSPRDSYAHCLPACKLIFIENESIRILNISSLQDIVLHEIAHGIAGQKAKHGKEFRKVCKQIGCKGNRANNNYECYELRGKFPHQL